MATQYYVSPDGNDNWAGTEARPFKTITKATKAVGAGDTIYVMNGTYHEVIDIGSSGTVSNPIVIMAYPGHKPVIDGRAGVGGINSGLPKGELKKINPRTGAGANFAGLFDVTGSNVTVIGFEIMRSMGRGMRVFSRNGRKVENVTIKDCNVHHSRQTNLLVTGPRTSNGGYTCSHVTVENSKFSWSGNYFPSRRPSNSGTDWSACIVGQGANYLTLRRCEIFENWGEATIADANQGGSQNIIIEDCLYYDNMRGVYLHAVQNAIFRRNFVYRSTTDRNRSNPFGPNNGVRTAPAEHERFQQRSSRNIRILNNIFVGVNTAIGMAGSVNKEQITDVLIAYNTVVNCSMGVSARIANKRNINFHNNLVMGSNSNVMVDDAGGRTNEGWNYSHNFWSHRPNALNGPNDIIGDPKLKNPNGFPAAGQADVLNYTLTADSLAKDAALPLDDPKDDYFQDRRGGSPDMGFDEYSPSAITADFDANPLEGTAPLAVTFQDKSTSSEPITSWLWDFGDGSISGQQNPTHVYTDGSFSVSLRVTSEAGSDLVSKSNIIVAGVPPVNTPPRVTDGLVALYRFDEGIGQTLHDVSGKGLPLDLQISQPSAVNWLDDGLAIVSPTIIASPAPAQKIIEACQESNEISLELWLSSLSENQSGPARIASISLDEVSRNITIGQGLTGTQPKNLYDVRLRTTGTSANGLPSLSSPAGSLVAQKTHVVFTRQQSGNGRIFVNGNLVAESPIAGDFSTWNPSFPLILANETNGAYPWLGQYFLLAAYSRALSNSEVKQNYDAGSTAAIASTTRATASIMSFRRFYIAGVGASNRSGIAQASAFGVQYPDQRCVTCINDGQQNLIVHNNLDAALKALSADRESITWIDEV